MTDIKEELEKKRIWQRNYRKSDSYKEYIKKYRSTEKYKRKHLEEARRYRETENGKRVMKEYRVKNRENILSGYKTNHYKKLMHAKYKREMLNPKKKINKRMGSLMWSAIKGIKAGRSWKNLVSYTVEDLMVHLEKQFDNNMNWGNYGTYWHIDHIKPKSLFKFKTTNDKQFKECWDINNLQPLKGIINVKKGNRFVEGLRHNTNDATRYSEKDIEADCKKVIEQLLSCTT